MFWGLTLEPGKRYTKTVDNPFHISAAVLDTSACDDDVVRVIVEVDDSETETIIANLSLKHGILQSQLDLQFESGSHVAFYTQGGASSVHLSGYNVFDVEEAVEEEEEESSDEETPVLIAKETAKRKTDDTGASTSKKAKLTEWDTPKNSMKKMHKKIDDVQLDELKDEDSGEEEEDSGEEEEDSEEEEDTDEDEDSDDDEAEEVVVKSAVTSAKTENLSKQTNIFKESKAAEPNSVLSKTPKSEQNIKKEKTPKQELKTPNKQKGKPATPEKTPVTSDKAVPKNKTPKQDVNAINGKTPKSEKAAKNADKLKNTPVIPQLIKKSPKVVKSGGVTCEDIVVGNGPEAKRGNMISVYYEGRLMSNKKMFDKCDSGKGFKFRLGMGEVISGWDVGVSGMKVGGKRRIICPPQMAYGKKGAPPNIPPQSTLMFMVELKGIN